jgi:deoxyhypusine synthase
MRRIRKPENHCHSSQSENTILIKTQSRKLSNVSVLSSNYREREITILEIFFQVFKQTDRPSDRRLSAKLGPTFSDKGCRVVSAKVVNSVFLTGAVTFSFK